jgi:hypothetical protein
VAAGPTRVGAGARSFPRGREGGCLEPHGSRVGGAQRRPPPPVAFGVEWSEESDV